MCNSPKHTKIKHITSQSPNRHLTSEYNTSVLPLANQLATMSDRCSDTVPWFGCSIFPLPCRHKGIQREVYDISQCFRIDYWDLRPLVTIRDDHRLVYSDGVIKPKTRKLHDDVITWKRYLHTWPVSLYREGNPRFTGKSPYKGPAMRRFEIFLVSISLDKPLNSLFAGDLRRHDAHATSL